MADTNPQKRLTLQEKFELYVEARNSDAPIGQVLRRIEEVVGTGQ